MDKNEINYYLNTLLLNKKTLVKGQISFAEIEKQIWESTYDPRFPYTGWANGNYKLVNVLDGKNSNILPKDAQGAMIDGDIKTVVWEGNSYYYSNLFKIENSKNKHFKSSIFCFVSDDFNGKYVKLSVGGYSLHGKLDSFYDLSKKGVWQKLEVYFNSDSSFINNFFLISNDNKKDNFKNSGHVIFAYPELKELKFDPKNPQSWSNVKFEEIYPLPVKGKTIIPDSSIGCKINNSLENILLNNNTVFYSTLFKDLNTKNRLRYRTTVFLYASEDFNGEDLQLVSYGNLYGQTSFKYDLSKRGEWQKLTLITHDDRLKNYSPAIYYKFSPKQDIVPKGYIIIAHPDTCSIVFSPLNPDTYAHYIYTREYPLYGNNSKILPKLTVGCQFNSKSKGYTIDNRHGIYNMFNTISVSKGDSIYASVYCYISNDFSGDWAGLDVWGAKFLTKKISLETKGEWFKVSLNGVSENDGIISGLFNMTKYNATDFNNLKGHITFAYPELIIKKNKMSSSYKTSLNKKYLINNASLSSYLFFFSNRGDSINNDSISNNVFSKQMTNDRFAGPRIDRWRYAVYLYCHEYKWWQKIIGGGFGYTRKFAKEFNDSDEYDYPHNPFLGVLLYSGILGLIAYIWFLYKAIYYYWIYRKEYWTLGLAFCASFFFAFFSANTPFDPAIMGILTILPYFIHYYTLKEQNADNE